MLTTCIPARPHTRSQTLRLAHCDTAEPPLIRPSGENIGHLPANISTAAPPADIFAAPVTYQDSQLLQSVCDLLYCTLDHAQGEYPLIISSPRHLQPGRQLGRFIAWPCGGNTYECPIYPDGGLSIYRYSADSPADALLMAIWLHPDCQAHLPGTGWPQAPVGHDEFLARAAHALTEMRSVLAHHAAMQNPQTLLRKPPVMERIAQLLDADAGLPSNRKMFDQLQAEGYREFNNLDNFTKFSSVYKGPLWKTRTRDNGPGHIDRILMREQIISPRGHTSKEWRKIIQERQPMPGKMISDYFTSRRRSGHLGTDPATRRLVLDLQGFRFGAREKARGPCQRDRQVEVQASTP